MNSWHAHRLQGPKRGMPIVCKAQGRFSLPFFLYTLKGHLSYHRNEDIPEIVGDSKHLKHLYKDIMKNMMINLSS